MKSASDWTRAIRLKKEEDLLDLVRSDPEQAALVILRLGERVIECEREIENIEALFRCMTRRG